jgi:ribosomal-protein-alanine N-acetyltransferase
MQLPRTWMTSRLAARPPSPADADAAFRVYAGDPEVTRYLSWSVYVAVEPLREFFAQSERRWQAGEGHRGWLLHARASGELIGSIGMTVECGRVVFGYVLGRAYWGCGYTTEALRHLVNWSLAQPGIWRAWAYCDVENPASARVMEKAGMQREGLLRRWCVAPALGPEPRDAIVCAKVR